MWYVVKTPALYQEQKVKVYRALVLIRYLCNFLRILFLNPKAGTGKPNQYLES